jgi:hypothetical protein
VRVTGGGNAGSEAELCANANSASPKPRANPAIRRATMNVTKKRTNPPGSPFAASESVYSGTNTKSMSAKLAVKQTIGSNEHIIQSLPSIVVIANEI